MSNVNDILFYLDQEPIDGPEDLYQAADTPIHNPSSRIMYAKDIKRQRREKRTLGRATDYCYHNLKVLRKLTATQKLPKFEPEESLVESITMIDNLSFLANCNEEVAGLISFISEVKSGKTPPEKKEETHFKPVNTKSQEDKEEVEKFYNAAYESITEEYKKIREELTAQKSTESPQLSERPLPRDPRLA